MALQPHIHSTTIIDWIDAILVNAIEASPLTTPTLTRNLALHKWERSFKNRNSLGSESGGSSLYEEIPYDILVPEDHEVLGPIIYRGQRCVVVEHDAEEDNGGQGDRH